MTPIEPRANVPVCRAQLREALRCAASALKANGPRFGLAGSYALWAFGAPEPSHDVDLGVAESDVDNSVATLSDAGFSVEHPRKAGLGPHQGTDRRKRLRGGVLGAGR